METDTLLGGDPASLPRDHRLARRPPLSPSPLPGSRGPHGSHPQCPSLRCVPGPPQDTPRAWGPGNHRKLRDAPSGNRPWARVALPPAGLWSQWKSGSQRGLRLPSTTLPVHPSRGTAAFCPQGGPSPPHPGPTGISRPQLNLTSMSSFSGSNPASLL